MRMRKRVRKRTRSAVLATHFLLFVFSDEGVASQPNYVGDNGNDDDDDEDEDDDDDDDDDDDVEDFEDWNPPSWEMGSRAPAPPGWKLSPEYPAPYVAEKIGVKQGPAIRIPTTKKGKVRMPEK